MNDKLTIKNKTKPKLSSKPKDAEIVGVDKAGLDPFERRGSVSRSPPLAASRSRSVSVASAESITYPMEQQLVETQEMEDVDLIDETTLKNVRDIRSEVESFMFNEANKITRNSIKFLLNKWTDMEKLIYKLTIQKQKLQTKIDEHANGLKNIDNHYMKKVTYAEVAKVQTQQKKTVINTNPKSPVVIIKSIDENSTITCEEVKEKFTKEMKPLINEIRIKKLRKIRENSILVEMESNNDLKKIEDKLKDTHSGLKVEIPKKSGPCIIIYDLDKSVTKEQFLDQLWSKNLEKLGLKRELDESKVRYKFSTFSKVKNTINYVIEVNGDIRKKILEQGRLYIEWRSYKVNDFISPTRCYRCL